MSSEIAERIVEVVNTHSSRSQAQAVDVELAEVRAAFRNHAIRLHIQHQRRDFTHGDIYLCRDGDCKEAATVLRQLEPSGEVARRVAEKIYDYCFIRRQIHTLPDKDRLAAIVQTELDGSYVE